MNKVFEVIEAKNIFNLNYDNISILTHPKSYIHAITKFENGLVKLLIHEPDMKIPIFNSIYFSNFKKIKTINPYNPFSYLLINKYLKHVNPDVILSTHWNPFFSISYSIINKIVPKRILKIGLLHNINSHEIGRAHV